MLTRWPCARARSSRTLSIAVRCPGVGMPSVPVFNVSSLGNCAYAAVMSHPAACPVTAADLSRRDAHLAYQRGVGAPPGGSTGETLGHVAAALLGTSAFYFAVGAAWRFSVLGMRGADVLPHAAFWRDFPAHAAHFTAGVLDEVRGLLEGAGSGVPRDALDEPQLPDSASAPLLARRRY